MQSKFPYFPTNSTAKFLDHRNTKIYITIHTPSTIGILYWHLDPKDYENNEQLKEIRENRGYNYMDLLELCPGKVENYEEKLNNFFREHIHGSGYFDVRGKDDHWIRIWIKAGDMIVLPAGIYHRFTLDTSNYVKLMRLFIGEPMWTAYNQPQEDHPARNTIKNQFKLLIVETQKSTIKKILSKFDIYEV
ncbi:unnamed protein product [Spirodela intermedia]|uniref:Probable inactive acireductone dioxygenase n=1 Tax=Spirodela intermedia TaxID=51605 RepID=A0A7I8IWQ5_SPIIN|nr:unnamed protein product [Spirodela intermedia]CAA6662250.1 unnamed protein product [Spirodela intermedia]